jgi:hypothetical protein
MLGLRDMVIQYLEDRYEIVGCPKYIPRGTKENWFSRVDLDLCNGELHDTCGFPVKGKPDINGSGDKVTVWLNNEIAAVGRPTKTTATIQYADPDFFTKLDIAIEQVPHFHGPTTPPAPATSRQ